MFITKVPFFHNYFLAKVCAFIPRTGAGGEGSVLSMGPYPLTDMGSVG